MRISRPGGRFPVLLLGIAGVVAVLLGVAVFAAAGPGTPPTAPAVDTAAQATQRAAGPAAPGFTVQTLNGETFALAEHRGEVVVVEFLTPGCPSCVVDVVALSNAARGDLDATFRIADLSGAPDPRRLRDYYRGELGAPPEVLIARDTDFQLARAYSVRELGHTVVITPDGRVSWKGRWTGDRTLLTAQIRKAASL